MRAQDRRLDQSVRLAQSLESDKVQHEMRLVDQVYQNSSQFNAHQQAQQYPQMGNNIFSPRDPRGGVLEPLRMNVPMHGGGRNRPLQMNALNIMSS